MVTYVPPVKVVILDHPEGQNLYFGEKNFFSGQIRNMLLWIPIQK